MDFNRGKFKALVHYICAKGGKRKLGSTKLNKILWYSDSFHYLMTGKPITGEIYKKEKYGPVPHHILSILNELREDGLLELGTSKYHGFDKARFNCLKKPDNSLFNTQEKNLINDITNIICKEHTAKSISKLSHDKIWEAAEIGEEIPLYAAFVSNIKKPDVAAKEWAFSAINKIVGGN